MRKIFTTIALTASFGVVSFSQTLAPAIKNGDGTFTYDFGNVVQFDQQTDVATSKGIDFIMSGVSGTPAASLSGFSNAENATFITDINCGTYNNPNPFNVGLGNKGSNFSISFSPKKAERGIVNARTEATCPDYMDYFGEYNATVNITIKTGGGGTPKSLRLENVSYILHLKGTSIANPTGIETSSFEPTKSLAYPNPAKDILHVSGSAEIFDLVGNKVAAGTNEINIEHLLSGIYVVKANGKSQKIVKE